MDVNFLIKKIKEYNKETDVKLIKMAFDFSEKAHEGNKRDSGDPYFIHPYNVALILTTIKADDKMICAALLHDVAEDTKYKIEDIRKEFGNEIASLVEGLTQIDKLHFEDKTEFITENMKKMLLASVNDIRIIVIKLADRLHNMRTLQFSDKEKQVRIAKNTMELFAPIAYRLGLAKFKGELEDLAFKYLNPEEYRKIENNLNLTIKQRENRILEAVKVIKDKLKEIKIENQIDGRVKHIYSIYRKVSRGIDFRELMDLIAVRIIVNNVQECYDVLGVVHNLWKPIDGKFKDYISKPKDNLYQSLHTVVIGPKGFPLEIQIRTREMHGIAEEGIAAHWMYKGSKDFDVNKKLKWMKEILEWQKESKDAKEQLQNLKVDVLGYKIYVFTPKGEVKELPKGSSPVDFAYEVHSDLGNKCSGARVNGIFVSLDHELQNGDIVEIITDKNHKPSRDWLKFVKSGKARSKILQTIRGSDKIPVKAFTKKEVAKESYSGLLKVKNIVNPKINFAGCCDPLPGDKIKGISAKSGKVVVHKIECENIKNAKKDRLVDVNWLDSFNVLIKIKVVADDRIGLLADLMNNINSIGINVNTANAKTINNNMAECLFTIKVNDIKILNQLINKVKNVKNVKRVMIEV